MAIPAVENAFLL